MELLLVFDLLACGCRKESDTTIAPPAVTISHPTSQPITEYLDLTGTVAASKSVDLVARVTGYLESVNFKDGDFVDEGQLLFVIEPAPYEQQLALNQAQLVQAQAEYDRQQGLMKDNATSTSNVEKQLSQRDQAQAQVELAKINLGYTRVTAPFAGRIGRRLVDPGNLVGAGGRDQARDARAARPDLRQLQPQRTRCPSTARGDAPTRHGGEGQPSGKLPCSLA